jgi:predicted dehydrogenase
LASSKLRVSLVGLDHWYAALGLAEAASGSADIELVAVADSELSRAQEVAAKYGFAQASDRLEEAAGADGVDLVISMVSTDRNPAVCIAAARAGNHLIAVKPMARTLAEASNIAAAVSDAGIHFLPGEALFRFTNWFEGLERWVQGGGLGDPISAYSWFWAPMPNRWHDDPDPGWFVDPKRAAGGGWIDHAIYSVDMLRTLWAREPLLVTCTLQNLQHPDLEVEDHGVAAVEFAGGAKATLEASWCAPAAVGFEFGLQMLGTAGAASVDSRSGRLRTVANGGSGWQETEFDGKGPEAQFLAHVVRVLQGREEPVASIGDGVRNLATALAGGEAAKIGSSVEIGADLNTNHTTATAKEQA